MFEDTIVEEDIHPVYSAAALTHAGRVRGNNQDAYVERTRAGIWAIADGMGGHRDGDVASRMVCTAIEEMPDDATLDWNVEELQRRMSHVNSVLYSAALRPVDPVQSGSTVVAMMVQRTACAILWAGDSRVYRLRHERLVQLTRDHTWAAQMLPEVDADGESQEETDHAITRAVGGEATLELEVRRDRVQLGDRYLLCSDGLTHELPAAQIAALLAQGDIRECAQALLEVTLNAGARDNVTIVVVDAN